MLHERAFKRWKRECGVALLMHQCEHLGDIFARDDPYEIQDAARAAFERGESAERFISGFFAEDIARRRGEMAEAMEAWAAREEEE